MNVGAVERLSSIRQRIHDRIGSSRFRTWFGDSTQLVLSSEGLDILVGNAFVGRWIAGNYMEELVAATRDVMGADSPALVRIVEFNGTAERAVEPRAEAPDAARTAPSAGPHNAARRSGGAGPTLRHDLESFVVGPGSRLAHAAAVSVVQNPGRAFKLLLVHSPCGLGKTHLLQGICNAIGRAQSSLECRYVTGESFTNDFIFAVKAGRVDAFRSKFRQVDVLVVDDIHFLANKRATQEEFLHTYNAIESIGKVVVLSSDCHPRAIATLSEPLLNRLISGMVVQIDPPDAATRLEILRRRVTTLGARIPDSVLRHLADKGSTNVREMEGALVTLIGVSALMPDQVTTDTVDRAMAESAIRTRPTPDPMSIAQTVGGRFCVSVDQILADSRERTIALARALTMFLVRRHTPLSFPEIGRVLGNKNHSTVLMATQRVERLLRDDSEVAWKTPAGSHDARVRAVIENLERELFPVAAAG